MIELRCRSGKRCVGRTTDGPAIVAKLTLCAACVVDIQRRYDELPHLSVALRSFLCGSMKLAWESKVNATYVPESPMDVRVADMLVEISDLLRIAVPVRDLISQPAVECDVWIGDTRKRRWLDGVDRAVQIRRVHERVSAMVGLGPLWRRRHAPCPSCGLPSLGSWGGSDWVDCVECGMRLTLDDYDAWCAEVSCDEKKKEKKR